MLKGFQELKAVEEGYLKCPLCDSLSLALYGGEGYLSCPKCRQNFPKGRETIEKMIATAAICANCGNQVTLEPDNHFGSGWMCAACDNIVAFDFEGAPVHPETIARLEWNESLLSKSQALNNSLKIANCSTKKDFTVLGLITRIAKEEDTSFRISSEGMRAALLYDRKSYLGYVKWTVDEEWAVLRQLYVVPQRQRSGLGSMLLNFWVQNIANEVSDVFGVESPNEKGLGLLVKNGYAKRVEREGEDGVEGIKCMFVQGF